MTTQDYKQEFMLDGACYLKCAYIGPVPQRAILDGCEAISTLRLDCLVPRRFLRIGNNCKEHRKQSRGVLSEYKTAA
jgi:hypothetical protein